MSATDHLANERTFLAWVRTAISLLGFGVLIARLRLTEAGMNAGTGARSGRLGLAFAGAGLLTLFLAAWQYSRTRRMIDTGEYESPVPIITAFAVMTLALGVGSVYYLVSILK